MLIIGEDYHPSFQHIMGRNDLTKVFRIGQTLAFVGVSVRPTRS
jgi:hypothetical protein